MGPKNPSTRWTRKGTCRGHTWACPDLQPVVDILNLIPRGQQLCSVWLPVYCSNLFTIVWSCYWSCDDCLKGARSPTVQMAKKRTKFPRKKLFRHSAATASRKCTVAVTRIPAVAFTFSSSTTRTRCGEAKCCTIECTTQDELACLCMVRID